MSDEKVVKLGGQKKKKKYLPFLYAAFALIIVGIFMYQVYKINYSPVKTEIALEKTVSNSVSTSAFVVRDETPIKANVTGTLVPLVEDGKRVANGDDVAVVFDSENAARNYNELKKVKEDIAYYSSLQNKVGVQTNDVETLDNRIYSACDDLVSAINTGEVDNYSEKESTLRDAITSRQLSTGTVIDPTQKLSELNTRLNELQKNEGGYTKIQANNPGYYISTVDGYENAVSYTGVLNLTTDKIDALIDGSTLPNADNSSYMGKLVDAFNWYILCVIDYKDAASLKVGGKITVEFTGTTAEPLSADVVKINDAADGRTSIILKCNLMNKKYAALRKNPVKLIFNTYTGYQVNNKAVREINGQKGVYVLNGNIVKFKKINIVYSDSEYSICSVPDGESGYLKQYDEIIVEGTDLYDGKILD